MHAWAQRVGHFHALFTVIVEYQVSRALSLIIYLSTDWLFSIANNANQDRGRDMINAYGKIKILSYVEI